jgi:SAM-dependent methyltransferase
VPEPSTCRELSRPSLALQLERGDLVCPRHRQPLHLAGDGLESVRGGSRYPIVGGVPLLLSDPERTRRYLGQQEGSMVAEYTGAPRRPLRKAWERVVGRVGDMRSAASEEAFRSIFAGLSEGALCVSVGGGPVRVHPALVNVNIGLFPNVDVVADAYELPYADGVVDAVHCEAVLEHLEFPDTAVREMHRVLRPGGKLFAATPFLQVFHGYPDHYQNFTLTGHVRLFERAGFAVLSAGTCVGPTFAIRDLVANYFRKNLAGYPGKLAAALWSAGTLPVLYLDRSFDRRSRSADVASTTYLQAVK